MNGVRSVTVAADEAEIRLDRWFRRHFPGLGHGRLEKLLRTGQVRVDGKRAKSGTRLASGQVVRVPPLPAENPERAAPQSQPRPQPTARDVVPTSYPLWTVAADVVERLVAEGGIVSATGPPGTALIFGDCMVHGSPPNMSPWPGEMRTAAQ